MQLKNFYLTNKFFRFLALGILLVALGFLYAWISLIGFVCIIGVFIAVCIDYLWLFQSDDMLDISRNLQERMNLGDENQVQLTVTNKSIKKIELELYEGFPTVMQAREKKWNLTIEPAKQTKVSYTFRPTKRGIVDFFDVVVLLQSLFGLAERRIVKSMQQQVAVYPSFLQLKKYDLMVFQQKSNYQGIKRIRKLGSSTEFEQINPYVQGNDIRSINWKATSRRSELMVNLYQDDKAQSVYSIIDKGRPMQLQFKEMTILDYAINSTLVLSNIVLKKGDRAGLITFSNTINPTLLADRKFGQLQRIQNMLYNETTDYKESNYEKLYQHIKNTVPSRALCMLYTNFESTYALQRVLPQLKALNSKYVLVVVLFQNTEIEETVFSHIPDLEHITKGIVAEKMASVKWNIVTELRKNGIRALLTRPDELNVQVINSYLELKAKSVI